MAYGLDVPLTVASGIILLIGAVVVAIMLAKGGGPKKTRGPSKDGKKPSTKKSSTKDGKKKSASTPKTEKKTASKAEKKTASTPKTEKKEVKKSDPKKEQPAASTSETPAVAESPKTETKSKNEKKKQAKKAAKPVAVEPEETSAEDIEFARTMSSNAKKAPFGASSSKKAETEAAEAEAAEPSSAAGARNWAEINAKNSEVQKFKAKLKESEKEVAELRRIIEDNKKKMREYNLTNAKLVSEKTSLKESYEEKIARLKADIEARRENRDVTVKSGDALRDRNYVVNVLQQERDTYKNQCTDLQLAYDDLRKEYQKLSEGDNEKVAKGLQQQLEAVSMERNKLVAALQEATQSEATVRDQLQAERLNVAKLTALLDSGANNTTGKEHAAGADEDGKEDETIST